MAEAEDQTGTPVGEEGSGEPQPCMPCRGSGKVISNLGATHSTVTCPWCRGGGLRIAGADAQEYQREQNG